MGKRLTLSRAPIYLTCLVFSRPRKRFRAKQGGNPMKSDKLRPIPTEFTEMLGCDFPIIAGPMFLVSNTTLTSIVSQAGAVGGMPSLNWRTTAEFRAAVREVKSR